MFRNKIKKDLAATEGEYIVSYISLNHRVHSLLAISKRVGNQYYLVNTIGIQQVNANQAAYREYADADVRAIFEIIHPYKSDVPVNAKHYAISNNAAKKILEFINHKRGRPLSFGQFSTNCHNFVMAILDNNGIHDKKLYSYTFPAKFKTTCTLTRAGAPSALLASEDKDGYLFIDKNNQRNFIKPENNRDVSTLMTWKWPENIKIKSTISYEPEEGYFKVIANTPNSNSHSETPAQIRLKNAIFLLRDYADASFFWHPGRNYRTLVNTCLDEFEANEVNKTLENLLIRIREAIHRHHQREGGVAYVKGSLHRRLRFIDFILNNTRYEEDNKSYNIM